MTRIEVIGPHTPRQHLFCKWVRCIPWLVCRRCGLVLLHNDVSRAAAKRPCE